MSRKFKGYLGNPNLKEAGVKIDFTEEQIREYVRCSQDPIYFIKKYVKVVSLDKGLVPFDLYDYQEDMINKMHNNRYLIAKLPRQSGKSTTIVAFILHYILFNQSMSVGILANKMNTAREILGRLRLAYEYLPKWLQQGIIEWNKTSIQLENGSKVMASATSSSAVRGGSFNLIFLDEFAHVSQNIAEEFFSSVYPTITSGQTTKVFMVSTPNGLNMFYSFWKGATRKQGEEGKNE
jgi:phage terminase large subunit-like protein